MKCALKIIGHILLKKYETLAWYIAFLSFFRAHSYNLLSFPSYTDYYILLYNNKKKLYF